MWFDDDYRCESAKNDLIDNHVLIYNITIPINDHLY